MMLWHDILYFLKTSSSQANLPSICGPTHPKLSLGQVIVEARSSHTALPIYKLKNVWPALYIAARVKMNYARFTAGIKGAAAEGRSHSWWSFPAVGLNDDLVALHQPLTDKLFKHTRCADHRSFVITPECINTQRIHNQSNTRSDFSVQNSALTSTTFKSLEIMPRKLSFEAWCQITWLLFVLSRDRMIRFVLNR